MTLRTRLALAGVLAASLTRELAHAQRARRDAWVEGGYTRVRQEGFAPSDVASVSALVSVAADALAVQATGTLLAAPGGGAKHFQSRLLQASLAISRSLNFWILPVEVFGNSANTMTRGHL